MGMCTEGKPKTKCHGVLECMSIVMVSTEDNLKEGVLVDDENTKQGI